MGNAIEDGRQPPEQIKEAAAVGGELKRLFPALFSGQPKPLKLRIQTDIEQRAPGRFARAALTAFLRRYTATTAYLNGLARSGHRFDLDGQACGELSAEHQAAAKAALAERHARVRAREAEIATARTWRANLLRDWECSTLSRSNFCALKGVTEAALDALIEQARAEAKLNEEAPALGKRGRSKDRRSSAKSYGRAT